tara:strand:+ start:307 stop:498 length:192 start_codon:yes stop_codon:yes gene_type:complete
MPKTKEEIIECIETELPWVNIKPYSHNLISLCLKSLYNIVGKEELNQYMKNSGLLDIGWRLMK